MLVNLPSGKVIDMSVEDYLRMGSEGYGYMMSQNMGIEMEDPFFSSILRSKRQVKDDDDDEEEEEEKDAPSSLEEGFFFETDE